MILKNFSTRTKLLLLFGFIVVGTWLVVALAQSFGGSVPTAFSEARMQGALIAQNIVDTSNKSVNGLEQINKFDKEGNFTEALSLLTVEVSRSQEIRDEAVKLSAELEKMTKALSGLKSTEARQAALEAIGDQLSLISRLINYSGYLGRLLEVLRNRFVGNFSDSDNVSDLVSKINTEVQAVNDFNAQANEAIRRFDGLVN